MHVSLLHITVSVSRTRQLQIISIQWHFQLQPATRAVPRACQPLELYKRMTSSRWHAVLRTEATGLQSWDGSTQWHVITSLITSPWEPLTRRLLQSWRLQRLLVYTALRSFVLLTLLSHQLLCQPVLLTYRDTPTSGRHRHSSYSVSKHVMHFQVCGIRQLHTSIVNTRTLYANDLL